MVSTSRSEAQNETAFINIALSSPFFARTKCAPPCFPATDGLNTTSPLRPVRCEEAK